MNIYEEADRDVKRAINIFKTNNEIFNDLEIGDEIEVTEEELLDEDEEEINKKLDDEESKSDLDRGN